MKTLIVFAMSFGCVFANAQTQLPATYHIEININGHALIGNQSAIYAKTLVRYLPALEKMKASGKENSDYVVDVIIDSPAISFVSQPAPEVKNPDFDITYTQNVFKIALIDNHSGKTLTNMSIKSSKAPILNMRFFSALAQIDEEGNLTPGIPGSDAGVIYQLLITNNTGAVQNFRFKTKPMDIFRSVKPVDMEALPAD